MCLHVGRRPSETGEGGPEPRDPSTLSSIWCAVQGPLSHRLRLADSGAFPRLREPARPAGPSAPPLSARVWRPVVLAIALLGLVAGAVVTRWAHDARAGRAVAAAEGLASARARAVETEIAALVEGLHALEVLLEGPPVANGALASWAREVASRHPSFDGVVWVAGEASRGPDVCVPDGPGAAARREDASHVVALARARADPPGRCALHVASGPVHAGQRAPDAWLVLVRPAPAGDAFAVRLVLARVLERLSTSEDPTLTLALRDASGTADLARAGDVDGAEVVATASVDAVGHRLTLAAGGAFDDVLPRPGVSPWLLGALAMLVWEVVNAALVALAAGWRGHALERQARVVHRVLHTLRESVILTDRDGHVVLANAEARRLVGSPGASPLHAGQLLPLLVDPEAKAPDAVRSALLAEVFSGATIEIPVRRFELPGTGAAVWLESVVCPVAGTSEVEGALVVSRDVTARREADEVARRMRERDAEMALAHRVQARLYPRACPAVPGLRLAGVVVPAAATCGDYYDVLVRPDGSVLIAIGDVSGHGFGPAIVMAEVRTMVRAMTDASLDPVEILRHVDAALAHEHDGELFVTLLLVTISPSSGAMAYVNAGHVPAQHVDARGRLVARMPATGPPLGIGEAGGHCLVHVAPLHDGDLLVAVTDGATESPGPDDEPFDDGRVLEVARAHLDETPECVVSAVAEAVFAWSQGRSRRDDVTVVVAKAEAR